MINNVPTCYGKAQVSKKIILNDARLVVRKLSQYSLTILASTLRHPTPPRATLDYLRREPSVGNG